MLPIGPARRHNTVALTPARFSAFSLVEPSGWGLPTPSGVERLERALDPAAEGLTATAIARAGHDLSLDLDA